MIQKMTLACAAAGVAVMVFGTAPADPRSKPSVTATSAGVGAGRVTPLHADPDDDSGWQ